MIDIDTVLFIETLRDLAKKTLIGFKPLSLANENDKHKIIYDDNANNDEYVICPNVYDTDYATFRVRIDAFNKPYIFVSVNNKTDFFMIQNGEWFSI